MSVAFWFDWTNSFYFVKLIKFLMLSFPCFFLQFFCRLISWNCRSNASSWIRSAFDIDSVRRRAHTHTQRERVFMCMSVWNQKSKTIVKIVKLFLSFVLLNLFALLSLSLAHTHILTHSLIYSPEFSYYVLGRINHFSFREQKHFPKNFPNLIASTNLVFFF